MVRTPGLSGLCPLPRLRQARMQASMCRSTTVRSLVEAASQGSSKASGPWTCASSRISMHADRLGDLQ